MIKKSGFLFVISIFLSFSSVYADIGDWTSYTNKSDIRDIGIYNNFIWCATNGGIFKYSSIDSSFEEFTNTSGLTSNDVNALDIDEYGNVWFGMSNGYINTYMNETKTWKIIDDIVEQKEHVVFDLFLAGDSLFVAIDIGISLYHHIYDEDSSEVKETYKNLGVGFEVEIPVKCIFLHGREIWAGTDYGVAKSNLDNPNLQAPNSWVYYNVDNSSLLSNKIQSIFSFDGAIYVATDQGICKFDGSNWFAVNSGLGSSWAKDVSMLTAQHNSFYAGTRDGVYQLIADRWVRVGEQLNNVTSISISESGALWAGRSKTETTEGFSYFDNALSQWHHFVPPGPGGNNFKGLAVDHDAVLWCCSKDGIFRFDGLDWKYYNMRKYGFNNNFWAVVVDSKNQKWFTNWGNGVAKLDENENFTFYTYDVFSGIDIDPQYIPVTNAVVDHDDNVWFTIYGAADGNVVAVTTPEGDWQYFSTSDGIITNTDKELYGLSVDQNNRIWVGSRNGVTVVNHNNTLFNKSDDDLSGTLTTTDGLASNEVKALAEDYDGIMWLGTNRGLNYWLPGGHGGAYAKSGVIHDNIETIAVDIRNNKWFGTSAGVSMLSPDNYQWTHYTTENSPLVSFNVTSIAFDEKSGRVYIGTTNGLSCFETPFAKPQANLDNVLAGPNPFIIGKDDGFRLLKLADNVSIKFFTSNGMLVRKVSKDFVQGFYEWDGKNDDGDIVASGIYVYMIYNEETGLSTAGKVAIIKQ